MALVALAVSLIAAAPANASPSWNCEGTRCTAVYRDVKRTWGEPQAHCDEPCAALADGKAALDEPARAELPVARFGQTALAELTRLLDGACAGGGCAAEVQKVRTAAALLAKRTERWELRDVSKVHLALREFEAPGGMAEFMTSAGLVAVSCIRLTDVLGHPVRCGVSFPVPQALGSRAEYVGLGVDGVQEVTFGSKGRIVFDPHQGLILERAALGIHPPPGQEQQSVEPVEQQPNALAPSPSAATPRDAPAASAAVTGDDVIGAGSAVVSAAALLGAGAYGASRIHGASFLLTGGTAVGGAALSLWPAMALDENAPWRGGWGPEGALRLFLFSAGAVGAPMLGALGTWGTGELLHGSRAPGAAFGGAIAGAVLGELVGMGLSYLLRNVPDEFKPLTLGITVGFIGSGASVGYQLLGGGPRP